MTVGYRHSDPRFPFFWEVAAQPPARWHGVGDGPVQYLADTPDGAWAEYLRHEEIVDPADLASIKRRIWAVEFSVDDEVVAQVGADHAVARGDETTYPACQSEARSARVGGATCLEAPSAALLPGTAGGQRTAAGLAEGPVRDGTVWVLVGARPDLVAWACVDGGAPTRRHLQLVSHL